jgi:uncharacterized protein YraI
MIRIAQAARPESGKGKWGMPPNQLRTGATAANPGGNMDGELEVRAFYGGWQKVFRPISSTKGDRIAYLAEETVRNGKYGGYGQNNGQYPRTGLFDELKKMSKPEPMQIKTLFNVDCTSMLGASVYFAGIKKTALRTMWSGTARDILLETGEFVELTDKTLLQSGVGIKRGDLLWKEGHMAVALDSDKKQDTTPIVICDCSACNLRSGPGTNYGVIKTLHPGDRGELISKADNGWGQVKIGSVIGHVSPLYYKELKTMKATGNVWLRKGAGTSNAGIIVIPKGATAYVTGDTKKVLLTTWHKAIYAGREGWASGKYLKA